VNVLAKFAVRSFTVPEILIAIRVGNWEPPNLGEEEAIGVGDGTVRKSVGEFLQGLHSNFYSTFTRFRDCRFCAPARHFSPPHL